MQRVRRRDANRADGADADERLLLTHAGEALFASFERYGFEMP